MSAKRERYPRRPAIDVLVRCVLALVVLWAFLADAWAQEGHHGVNHETWHSSFYSHLMRPDTKTSCCNLSDCRPTQGRQMGDHYEVLVDGAWTPVPPDKVVRETAPDGGYHVCAPEVPKGILYCVILPPEG
jgi:hypothetical protein